MLILRSIFLVLILQVSLQSTSAEDRNVLFIIVDDLNTRIKAYGSDFIHSPNIDTLAARGVVFRNSFCQWPVCGATRASVLTGLTPDGSGIRNLSSQLRDVNPEVVTLPQYFRQNGFTTAAVGKVFDPRNVDEGNDILSWSHAYTDPGSYDYPAEYGDFVKGTQYRVTPNTATEKGPAGVGDDGYVDGQICLEALEKLEGFANSGERFFLAVGFKKPHIPFVAPEKYWDIYNPQDFILAPYQKYADGSPDFAYHSPEPLKYDDIPDPWTYSDENMGDSILDPENQLKLLHGYYACVSYIDAQVGKLIEKLSSAGLDENTIIVLWGDHGYHLGDHNQWGKHTIFEASARAPMIIYAPGNNSGSYESPVEFLDIFPTVTDLAGLPVPAFIQGKSLAPVLDGFQAPIKPVAVSEYRSEGHAAYSFRTERYRYTLWFEKSDMRTDVAEWNELVIESEELYDYLTDPLETRNLDSIPDYQSVRDSLLNLAKNWWEEQRTFFKTTGGHNYPEKITSRIFPNPVRDFLFIDIQENFDIRVTDLKGELHLSQINTRSPVDMSSLQPGTYIIRIRTRKDVQTQLLIVT